MSTTSDQLGREAAKMAEDLQNMGETVRVAANEKLGQMGEKAAEYRDQGRDHVHGVACACEQFVRARPLRSILMATGIGWLLGRFWKRG